MKGAGRDVSDWWKTEIIDMAPGQIRMRGHPIEELIGQITFPQMIWLMTRGELPSDDQASLLECALVAAVDHGPQAPSIATARMAVSCGLGLNGAMASAVAERGESSSKANSPKKSPCPIMANNASWPSGVE